MVAITTIEEEDPGRPNRSSYRERGPSQKAVKHNLRAVVTKNQLVATWVSGDDSRPL